MDRPGEPVNNRPLLLASGLSVCLGLFSLVLPNTEPKGQGTLFPFLDALELLNRPSFAIFIGISLLITLALAFYFSFTSLYLEQGVRVRPDNVGPLMTIGQWMEIIFLLALPWFLGEFGMRNVLIMGMAAWALRYAFFALGRPFPLILLALALHGICFDFFFVAGFIHVDKTAPAAIHTSAQALYIFLIYGLGSFLGNEAAGWVNQWCTTEVLDPQTQQKVRVTNWRRFWLIPCAGAVVSLILFVLFFQ